VKRTSSLPKIVVSADRRGVVGHAGTRLLADLADATGLMGALSQALGGLRQRAAGHDPGRVARDVALMLADGGETISDLVRAARATGVVRPGRVEGHCMAATRRDRRLCLGRGACRPGQGEGDRVSAGRRDRPAHRLHSGCAHHPGRRAGRGRDHRDLPFR
jgi:hypothetical protein